MGSLTIPMLTLRSRIVDWESRVVRSRSSVTCKRALVAVRGDIDVGPDRDGLDRDGLGLAEL